MTTPITAVRTALATIDEDRSATFAVAGSVLLRLVAPEVTDPEVVHVADALADGLARVDELAPPQVARLQFQHTGRCPQPVFVPAGTLVKGGGQNRIVSLSALLMPGETRVIEVRCVEARRWNPGHDGAFTTASSAPAWLKSRKIVRDTDARMERTGLRASDQDQTWRDVTLHLERTRTLSRTESLFDAIEATAPVVVPPTMLGAAGVCTEGERASAEVFFSSGLRTAGVRGLVESANRDVAGPDQRTRSRTFAEMREDVLAGVEWLETSVRGGTIVDVQGRIAVGSAFVVDDRVIHLALYEREDQAGWGEEMGLDG